MCEFTSACICQGAMETAYGDLIERNVPESAAFNAAVRIYRFHHPKASPAEARAAVTGHLDRFLADRTN